MKSISYLFTVFFTLNLLASTEVISLNDVASKVKESNFTVLENAQRVYQAKETITFSKRNLLPRLNFWNILQTNIPIGRIWILQVWRLVKRSFLHRKVRLLL